MASLDNFEKMDIPVTMNQLKFLQSLYEPSLLQRVAADMSRPKTNIKEIQDRASTYRKQQWINWHWGAAPDSVIHPSRSMLCSPDQQVGKHANRKHGRSIQTFHTCAESSPAEKVPLHDWDVIPGFRLSQSSCVRSTTTTTVASS